MANIMLQYKNQKGDFVHIGSGEELEQAFEDARKEGRALKVIVMISESNEKQEGQKDDGISGNNDGAALEKQSTGQLDEDMVPILRAVNDLIKDNQAMAELTKAFPEFAERVGKGEGVRASLDKVLSSYPTLRSHRFVEKAVSALWAVSAAIEIVVPPQKVGAVFLDIWFEFQPLVQSGKVCCHSPDYLLQKGMDAARRAVSCRKNKVRKVAGISQGERGCSPEGTTMCPIASMIGKTFLATMFSNESGSQNPLDALKLKKMIMEMKNQKSHSKLTTS